MTLSLWLRIYGASVIGIMLLVRLGFPFGPLRQWLQSGPYVAKGAAGWAVVTPRAAGPLAEHVEPADGKWSARVKLGPLNLLRSWLGDLCSCYWCTGGWVALFAVLAFVPGSVWDRLTWWGALWAAASFTVAVVVRLED